VSRDLREYGTTISVPGVPVDVQFARQRPRFHRRGANDNISTFISITPVQAK
jgi:hypothetical protein